MYGRQDSDVDVSTWCQAIHEYQGALLVGVYTGSRGVETETGSRSRSQHCQLRRRGMFRVERRWSGKQGGAWYGVRGWWPVWCDQGWCLLSCERVVPGVVWLLCAGSCLMSCDKRGACCLMPCLLWYEQRHLGDGGAIVPDAFGQSSGLHPLQSPNLFKQTAYFLFLQTLTGPGRSGLADLFE